MEDRPDRADGALQFVIVFTEVIIGVLIYDCSVDSLLGLIPESNHSTDEMIRLVSDYTGLSTEAVTALHKYQEHRIQAQAKALDLLLTFGEGKAVLGQIFL